MKKLLMWYIFGGMAYYALEGHWHIPVNNGWANISMFHVGGLCFALIGLAGQRPAFNALSVRWKCLIGACIVTAAEFVSGCVLNVWLHLGVWDYSRVPFNLIGQICPQYVMLWILLMPTVIWLDNCLAIVYWKMFGGREPECCGTPLKLYKELICERGRRGQHGWGAAQRFLSGISAGVLSAVSRAVKAAKGLPRERQRVDFPAMQRPAHVSPSD